MNGQVDMFQFAQNSLIGGDVFDLRAALKQLQQPQTPRRYDDDGDISGHSTSDALSFIDSCQSPHSPFSPLSPRAMGTLSSMLVSEKEKAAAAFRVSEESVPVCYDFVQGRCARNNCKYLHDSQQIEKSHSSKRGICFDYLRGDCNRGAMCRFSHDVSNFAKEYKIEDDISLAKVKRWGQGICFDFVRGACNRGDSCPWSHNLLEIAVATKRGIENMETKDRNRLAETVRSRLCASLENKTETEDEYDHCEMNGCPPSAKSTTTEASEWIPLFGYTVNVFGPLDDDGLPLHWFERNNADFMEL